VKTTESKAAAAARIGAALGRRKRAELLELLRPCFARVEPWLQAGKYAAALMSGLPGRNGWTLAERAGDRAPDRMQRLLSLRQRPSVRNLRRPASGHARLINPVDYLGLCMAGCCCSTELTIWR
jgi:hypothetical protein